MLLVKVNEYKYQVLKVDQKNNITVPYEGQNQIAIYSCEQEATRNYVNIEDVQAEVVKHVEIDTVGHDDYVLSFDLYVDQDGNCSTHKFDMQATIEEASEAFESEDIKEKNVYDTLSRLKISEEEKVDALNLQLKLTSNKKDIEMVESYRDYLKSGEIKRKLIAKMKGGIPQLNDNLMVKYNTIICFLPEIEKLIVDTKIVQAEKELIVDYIYISRYKVMNFEKMFLSEIPGSPADSELTVKFVSNAKKLLTRLEDNPNKITKSLDFIASSLSVVSKMTKAKHFDNSLVSLCNQQTIEKLEEVNELIARDFDVIGTVIKGESNGDI